MNKDLCERGPFQYYTSKNGNMRFRLISRKLSWRKSKKMWEKDYFLLIGNVCIGFRQKLPPFIFRFHFSRLGYFQRKQREGDESDEYLIAPSERSNPVPVSQKGDRFIFKFMSNMRNTIKPYSIFHCYSNFLLKLKVIAPLTWIQISHPLRELIPIKKWQKIAKNLDGSLQGHLD